MFICPVAALVGQLRAALEQKDLDLAAAQQAAQEKSELAEKKLASVGALEAEIIRLKGSLDTANKEVAQLKKSRADLNDKYEALFRKRLDLEAYLGDLTKKMVPRARRYVLFKLVDIGLVDPCCIR